jgi:hypothetical protein
MKNKVLVIMMFACATLVFNGCNPEDTTSPIVTLVGASSMTVSLNSAFVDPGATATDDEDGTIATSAITVTGTVNKDLAGTYTLTYAATDAAGNTGNATRTVIVKNDAAIYEGTYSVTETCTGSPATTYGQTIAASTSVNNRVHFNKFGNYVNATGIYGTITGTTLDIPSQVALNSGSPSADRTFSGSASGITTSGFSLTYTEVTNGTSTTCTANFSK